MKDDDKMILDDIIELQSIAQAGLYYGKDEFDKERYQKVRDFQFNRFKKFFAMTLAIKLQN